MRRHPIGLHIMTLAVLAGGPALQAGHPASDDGGTTAFEQDDRGAVLIKASVNGAGPYRLLLDTGASRSLISSRVAGSLHLPIVAQTDLVTATGAGIAGVARVDRLGAGPFERQNLLATIVPSGWLDAIAPRMDGVIGQDVLRDATYTIDYRHGRVQWDESAPCGGSQEAWRLPLIADEGRYVVELGGGSGSRACLRLVPDTGASDLIVYRPADRGLGLLPTRLTAGLTSLAGRGSARVMWLPAVAAAHPTLANRAVIVADRPASTAVDGLLPLHRFSCAAFRGREGVLVLR